MHHKDFDLLSAALALEHRDAVTHGPEQAAVQAEHTALTIADAIAREHRTFDPVKFMLAACEATEIGQLTVPVRRQITARFGTDEPRPRLRSEHPGLYPDELIDTSRWTERSLIGATVGRVSGSHGVVNALIGGGVDTLGELLAKSDEELRAIPRVGPVAMEAIHTVQDLWRAKQQPVPEIRRVQPSSAMPAHAAELGAQAARLDFPQSSPLPGPGRATSASVRRPARPNSPRPGNTPGA